MLVCASKMERQQPGVNRQSLRDAFYRLTSLHLRSRKSNLLEFGVFTEYVLYRNTGIVMFHAMGKLQI
jgi:hypothetical protein